MKHSFLVNFTLFDKKVEVVVFFLTAPLSQVSNELYLLNFMETLELFSVFLYNDKTRHASI